ncbi:MAG TPA: hypothetical protein VK988_10100 [Acidimicrobiales bacterium]|nr:hypothetical protein [Acidimicrobiales bacterium]
MRENVESDDAARSGLFLSTGGTKTLSHSDALQSRDNYLPEFLFYGDLGLKIGFDERTHRCNIVESWYPPCAASVHGIPLVGAHDDVASALSSAGYALYKGTGTEEGSTYCDELGLGLWREDVDDQDIETVAAFVRESEVTTLRRHGDVKDETHPSLRPHSKLNGTHSLQYSGGQ